MPEKGENLFDSDYLCGGCAWLVLGVAKNEGVNKKFWIITREKISFF